MSENKPAKKRRRGKFLKRLKTLIKLLLILAILAAAGLFGLKAYIARQAESDEEKIEYTRAAVLCGAMNDTVYGTGTTSAKNQPNILAETQGTLTDLRVAIGDEVKEGDILAVISNQELDDTITDYEFALWQIDDDILGTGAEARVSNIKAPINGRLMAIYAQVGDDALAVFRREGALAIISTDGRMKVELSDIPTSMGIALGQTVRVTGETVNVEATVSDLTMQGTSAVITVIGDKYPMGEAVRVTTLDGALIGESTLEVNKPMAVSSFGGTIQKISKKVGAEVKRRDIIFQLEDSPLGLNLEDLRLQREAAAKDLAEAKEQRENLIVLAPCDGVVASLEVAEGDAIESGTLIGSILHGEDMKLTIAVDELDVVEVQIGQSVEITIDALPGALLTGVVDKIAPVGANSGGVTTYDVELAFDAAGTGVRSGMNATGEIEIAATDHTLYVPVEAIMTIHDETYVMVEDGGSMSLTDATASQQSGRSAQRGQRGGMPQGGDRPDMGGMTPQGEDRPDMSGAQKAEAGEAQSVQPEVKIGLLARVMAWLYEGVDLGASAVSGSLVKVEVGMQNDDYAEILSGVSEGDVVLYTSDDSEQSAWSMMGGRGGMGGMRMGF